MTSQDQPQVASPQPLPEGDEAFLVSAFALGVHFLSGFFVAAAIFLLAMPMEPEIVRKAMLGFAVAFSAAGSALGTYISVRPWPTRNLGWMLVAAAFTSLAFMAAVQFTVADPRFAQMAAETNSAIGFGGDAASFLVRLKTAQQAALIVGGVGILSLIASRFSAKRD